MIIQTFICDGCSKEIEENEVINSEVTANSYFNNTKWNGNDDLRGHLCPECGKKLVKAIKEKKIFLK